MSNLELAREILSVWKEQGLRAVLERYDDFFTDDLEWRTPVTEMTGPQFGREGFERYVADVEGSLTDIRPGELVEIAPEVLRSRTTMHGEGVQSGAAIDAPIHSIGRFRDGRCCWWWATYDRAASDRVAEAIARGEEVQV